MKFPRYLSIAPLCNYILCVIIPQKHTPANWSDDSGSAAVFIWMMRKIDYAPAKTPLQCNDRYLPCLLSPAFQRILYKKNKTYC